MVGKPVERHPPQFTPVPLITAPLLPILELMFETGQTAAGIGDFIRLAAYGREAGQGKMEVFVDGVDHYAGEIIDPRILSPIGVITPQ